MTFILGVSSYATQLMILGEFLQIFGLLHVDSSFLESLLILGLFDSSKLLLMPQSHQIDTFYFGDMGHSLMDWEGPHLVKVKSLPIFTSF
jgi:hypothetical protein